MKELKIIIWVSWRSLYTEGQRHNFREVAMKRLFLILSLLLPVTLLVSSASLAATNSTRLSFLMTAKTLFGPKRP